VKSGILRRLGGVWLPTDERRWKVYLTDDEPPELAFLCPECAERELRDCR
jgi:hypothetical protein